MNYKELKNVAEARKMMIKDIAEALEMTPNGFKVSIESEKFPIGKVKPLCALLGINVSEFFGESAVSVPMSGASVGEVAWLRNQLSVKDGEIDRLLRLMESQAGLQPKKVAV